MPLCRFSSSSPCCLFPSSSSSSPVPFPSKRLHFPPPKRRPTAVRAALKVGVEDFVELAHNKVLVASVVAGAIGQLSKPLTEAMNGKGIDLKAAFRSGGMPSTHSAGVVAATTSLGLERGFSDSIFGMSAVFAALVMYDAQGVRREVGYHAKILNQILTLRDDPTPSSSEFDIQPRISSINFKETPSSIYDSTKAGSYASTSGSYSPQTSAVASMDQDVQSLKVNDDDGQLQKEYIKYNPLNESVGHTELQVLVGALLGFIDDQRVGPDIRTLLRRFWKIAAPYWLSEDKVQDRLRLAAVFALTLATTGISVGFNFLGRDFYNALANKDQEQFTKQLLYYLGAFSVGIPFFVLRDYSKETLSLRWRSWMTSYYISRYFKNQKFYKIQSQSIIDNPDQRIVDDLSSFTGIALSFSLTLLNAAVDLISFSNILYGIYPPLFIILLVYSLGGTAISVFLGKGLVNLNFMQEKKEADFRYGLVRARENAESIAFYGGEKNEMQLLLERFRRAYENLTDLLITSRNLEFFTNGYRYLIQILPAAVVAPMYFSGKIEFGVINQSASAFNHILSDFSLVVYQFQALSAFSAVIDRLGEFDDILDDNQSYTYYGSPGKINIFFKDRKYADSCVSNGSLNLVECHKLLDIQNLTLQTPRGGNVLITDLSLEIIDKDHLLVMGPSGSGKTSFLRALAGLWDTGEGNITFYLKDAGECEMPASSDSYSSQTMDASQKDEELEEIKVKRPRGLFFLPQRPYMVLGTLRQQLLYPTWSDHKLLSSIDGSTPESLQDVVGKPKIPTDDEMIQVLKTVYLEDLLSNFKGLDSVNEWSSVLSLGEQQRLAFARLLLSKPEFVLLDESTSALDNSNEAHLYKQIEAAGITYISIGHRNTLYNYHKKVLYIEKFESRDSNRRNWNVMPIDKRDKIEANTSS